MAAADRFKWGPRTADDLTLRELVEWAGMAIELNKIDREMFGGKTND